MNAPPVAPAPKDVTPQRASPPPLPAVGAAFDQLLSIGLASPQPAPKTDTPQPSTRPKTKNDSDDANAAAAAPATPQILPAITVTTGSGQATVATAALPTPAVKPPPPTTANAPDPTASKNADPNGTGAKLPPGAAELEARIVAGAPGYLSQPNAALAGLWHHVGEAAKVAAGQPGDASTAAATAAQDAATAASQAPVPARAADAATLAKALPDQQPTAPGIELAQAAAADSGKSGTAATVAADGSSTTPLTLPTSPAPPPATPPLASTDASFVAPGQIAPAWEQVAINLRQAAQGGSDRIEIQLKPASLGAISVKLDLTHDGHITAVISADRSDTLNLLRQHSDGLAQSLRDAGLQADSGSLSFNLRGDAQSFAQGPTPTVSPVRTDDATPIPTAPSEFARQRSHSGFVDIEV